MNALLGCRYTVNALRGCRYAVNALLGCRNAVNALLGCKWGREKEWGIPLESLCTTVHALNVHPVCIKWGREKEWRIPLESLCTTVHSLLNVHQVGERERVGDSLGIPVHHCACTQHAPNVHQVG